MIYDIHPKWLEKVHHDRWVGRRTILVPSVLAVPYTRSLYGKPWPGFSGEEDAPLIQRIRSEWSPDGYAATVRMILQYDTFGDRRPGFAKVLARRMGFKLVPIKRDTQDRVIRGSDRSLPHGPPGSEANAYREWFVVGDQDTVLKADFMIALIVKTALEKRNFNYAAVAKFKNTINNQPLRGLLVAGAGTLLCLGVECDATADPTDRYVYVDYFFLWDEIGWNSVQVDQGSWIVRTDTPVFKYDAATNTLVPDESVKRDVLTFEKGVKVVWDKTALTWKVEWTTPESRTPYKTADFSDFDGLVRWE